MKVVIVKIVIELSCVIGGGVKKIVSDRLSTFSGEFIP